MGGPAVTRLEVPLGEGRFQRLRSEFEKLAVALFGELGVPFRATKPERKRWDEREYHGAQNCLIECSADVWEEGGRAVQIGECVTRLENGPHTAELYGEYIDLGKGPFCRIVGLPGGVVLRVDPERWSVEGPEQEAACVRDAFARMLP